LSKSHDFTSFRKLSELDSFQYDTSRRLKIPRESSAQHSVTNQRTAPRYRSRLRKTPNKPATLTAASPSSTHDGAIGYIAGSPPSFERSERGQPAFRSESAAGEPGNDARRL
jgi:hypothetical protein